ncbi:unnamed protein product [Caenorhabditis auriculariae]|uniref:Anaphase-promoting complex subunit 11 n=1 Tax=Caenorhabditis auriculariae TaxID=2777116 RepID=A0A8S1H9D8_9PELO|nr:unnamed protein product [Caenorhabditis auriculariae]
MEQQSGTARYNKASSKGLEPVQDENLMNSRQKYLPKESVVLETKTRLKLTVNKLNVTAEWKWTEGGEDTCGICRMEFEAACTNCKFPGDDCPLVVGSCRHAFHMHCIVKWTEAASNQPKPQCPLCRQEWKFAT